MPDFKPDNLLGHKFRVVNNLICKYFDRCRQRDDDDMPRGQGMFVHYIINNGENDVFQKDLEEAFSLSGATASNMLKSLEKSGMIERIPLETDARLKKIVVTRKAIEQDVRIRKSIDFLEMEMFRGMSEEELVDFKNSMNKVIDNIERINDTIFEID